MDQSRRSFLASSALATAGLASVAAGRDRVGVQAGGVGLDRDALDGAFGSARRVIFAVSDGMSVGTLTLADMYSRLVLGAGETNWVRLMGDPRARQAMCTTHCSDSLVTDSAAASTTWSCGKKVYRGSIGFNDAREPETPILLRARDAGFGTGLVTTSSVTDATPAGFIANVPVRRMEREIAQQILDRAPTVVLGGGRRHFDDAAIGSFGGVFLDSFAELDRTDEASGAGSLVGAFADGHVRYALDRADGEADLASMARSALARLDALGDGFLLQVEAARVDHAAHRNDAVSMILEQIEFDRTLGLLIDYTESRDDTLLIVTTDHANANPGLTVYGGRGETGLRSLERAERSFDWIVDEVRERDESGENHRLLREIIEYATGVALDGDDLSRLRASDMPRANLFGEMDSFTSRLGAVLSNSNGIGFVSKNHTSDLVHASAIGAGAGLLRPMIDNTDFMPLVLHAMGVRRIGAG